MLIGLSGSLCLMPTLVLSADVSAGIPYQVRIDGIDDKELRDILASVSDTFKLRDRPPSSLNMLQRRLERDIPQLKRVLRSFGFYDGRVSYKIQEETRPVQVQFIIETGPAYILKSVRTDLERDDGASEQIRLPGAQEMGVRLDRPVRSKQIIEAEAIILTWLRRQGYPFARGTSRKVVVDHAKGTVSVHFSIGTGHRAFFGDTAIEGLVSVNQDFLEKKIPWQRGSLFSEDLLEEARTRLIATGLFATVQVKKGDKVDEKGYLPIRIEVHERKHRTVKAGVSFKTDEGPGGNVSWEHRNAFNRGERLTIGGNASGIAYALEGQFRRPEFRRRDQDLILSMRLAEDRPDAYTSRNITGLAQIERSLKPGMLWGVGLGYRRSKIEQQGEKDRFSLVSGPMKFEWDTSDDPLDPSRGGRLNLQFIPFYDLIGTNVGFLKGFLRYSRYLQISRQPSLILAARGTLGAMAGAERDEIPADIRFYAGGGGSIRGYGYQSVGPLRNNEPIGGRSLLTVRTELRMKITDKIGLAAFLDGGSAFEDAWPQINGDILWGAGMGLRYHTPIGPLRLDVGIPLDRREGIDDAFQVYISLGQAF